MSHPPASPPLIGIATHELKAEPAPAWAPAPGRRERDLAPARLHLRLTYVQAISEAGGLPVNSFHHQAVDRLGGGLDVIARAPDGTVEAVHDPAARFSLGVQWHAELLTHRAEHAPVIAALVAAASRPALRLVA